MSLFSDPSSRRLIWLAGVVAPVSLLAYGYYLQYVKYLDPCPLCITQRLFYMIIGVASLLGLIAIRKRVWQRLLAVVAIVGSAGGAAVAGRQVWLQHLPPDQVPECGLGLQYWLQTESPLRVLALLFKGDGNCAEVQWTFLSLSIGEWSLVWFIGFLVVSLALFAWSPSEHQRLTEGSLGHRSD
jgi:disulfide bond formation protein DsbB